MIIQKQTIKRPGYAMIYFIARQGKCVYFASTFAEAISGLYGAMIAYNKNIYTIGSMDAIEYIRLFPHGKFIEIQEKAGRLYQTAEHQTAERIINN